MFFILALLVSTSVFASIPPRPIPRTSSKIFVKTGVFEGGTSHPANIESLRFSRNPKDQSERWVLDFSDGQTRNLQEMAPRFQVRYSNADRVDLPEGDTLLLAPPRIIISLSSIKGNYLNRGQIRNFLEKSKLVKEITVYPPIEGGDTAVEFVLKKPVLFEPHQPVQKEGRLVLDLKPTR